MAGHSKFKNIMFRKGAQDAKRSKLFSKLAKEITVAARMGGGEVIDTDALSHRFDEPLDVTKPITADEAK